MQRSLPLLTLLLVLQLAAVAALAVRKNPLASSTPQTPLVGPAVESADHVVIEGRATSGAASEVMRVELAKQNGKWALPAYFHIPADNSKLTTLLGKLAALERGLPVATSAAALKRFKLLDDDFERRVVLSAAGKTLATIYFGSSPGARKSAARTAKDHAVYAVDLATYELPINDSDWLDTNLLQRDPATLTELDITTGRKPALQLVRYPKATASNNAPPAAPSSRGESPAGAAANDWVDSSVPAVQQLNGAHVASLAQDIAQLHVDDVLGLAAKPEWQQQNPALTLGIRDSQHSGQVTTWTLSKPDSSDYYVLKTSAQPWYFRVSSSAGKQLLDASATNQLLAVAGPKGTESAEAKFDHKRTAPAEKSGHAKKSAANSRRGLPGA